MCQYTVDKYVIIIHQKYIHTKAQHFTIAIFMQWKLNKLQVVPSGEWKKNNTNEIGCKLLALYTVSQKTMLHNDFIAIFTTESVSERILKIGQHLAKLQTKV